MDRRVSKPVIAAVALVSAAIFAATGASVVSMAVRAKPVAKAQAAPVMAEGVTIVPKTVRVVEIYPKAPDRVVVPAKTASAEPVTPVTPVTVAESQDRQVERNNRRHYADAGDICARHHLHKVIVGRGWRCRR